MRFDALVIKAKQLPNADSVLIPLIERGIDVVCVAGECTADPGFLVKKRAMERQDPILVIPGAMVMGSDNVRILVVGAVDQVTIPAINDTAALTHLVRANGGVTVAINPTQLVDTPGWTLIDGSVVWYEGTMYPRTVPASLAITGYNDVSTIGQAYTDVDCGKGIDLTRLMVTHPEKFVPVILRSEA